MGKRGGRGSGGGGANAGARDSRSEEDFAHPVRAAQCRGRVLRVVVYVHLDERSRRQLLLVPRFKFPSFMCPCVLCVAHVVLVWRMFTCSRIRPRFDLFRRRPPRTLMRWHQLLSLGDSTAVPTWRGCPQAQLAITAGSERNTFCVDYYCTSSAWCPRG